VEGLLWYGTEASWQHLVQQRFEEFAVAVQEAEEAYARKWGLRTTASVAAAAVAAAQASSPLASGRYGGPSTLKTARSGRSLPGVPGAASSGASPKSRKPGPILVDVTCETSYGVDSCTWRPQVHARTDIALCVLSELS
jgi:hypothetical protein